MAPLVSRTASFKQAALHTRPNTSSTPLTPLSIPTETHSRPSPLSKPIVSQLSSTPRTPSLMPTPQNYSILLIPRALAAVPPTP